MAVGLAMRAREHSVAMSYILKCHFVACLRFVARLYVLRFDFVLVM